MHKLAMVETSNVQYRTQIHHNFRDLIFDMQTYDEKFYQNQMGGAFRSAVKYFSYLFADFKPKTIIDFGCGVGSWLCAAECMGVRNLIGIDGSWVGKDKLLSKSIQFHEFDFETVEHADIITKLGHLLPADLALSLEVAEHLNEERAEKLIKAISQSAKIVVFGAAIPGQGGRNHVNEQWPSYWIKKFDDEGFLCCDYFRPLLWNDADVDVWYRQNTFLFIHRSHLEIFPFIKHLNQDFIPDVVHPKLFYSKTEGWKKPNRAYILRDAAIELEDENLDVACELMELASISHPDDLSIAKYLKKYKEKLKDRKKSNY